MENKNQIRSRIKYRAILTTLIVSHTYSSSLISEEKKDSTPRKRESGMSIPRNLRE